jgi:hypothetical protein
MNKMAPCRRLRFPSYFPSVLREQWLARRREASSGL